MRIVRFLSSGKVNYGLLENDVIRGLRGSPFTCSPGIAMSSKVDGSVYDMGRVRLLAPCLPSKIVCIGINYRSHAEETKLPIPEVPLIFLKPSTAVIGPDGEIVLPHQSRRVDYEGELAVVIGKRAKAVSVDDALNFVLGYTCFNDVSERYNQRDDGQWTRAKGYDTFAPMGPWIESDVTPNNLKLETYLNGELRQSNSTSDLIFPVEKLVSFISAVMTLLPGDVIATGTPSGIGRMDSGDRVEIRIDGIGALRNTVVRE